MCFLPVSSYLEKPSSKTLGCRAANIILIIFGKSLTLHKARGLLPVLWRDNPACGLMFGLAYFLPIGDKEANGYYEGGAGVGKSRNLLLLCLAEPSFNVPQPPLRGPGQRLKKEYG